MNKSMVVILVIVALLAVGGGAFYGGTVYGKGQAEAAQPNQAAFMQQRLAGRGGQLPAEGGWPAGDQAGIIGQGVMRGGTTGTLERVDGNTLIVTTADGPVRVLVTDDTLIQTVAQIGLLDLEMGTTITVNGARNDDGSIMARTILPAGDFGFALPIGGQ